MNVGELMAKLAKLPVDLPVVMSQEDEPMGNYGVAEVDSFRMTADRTFDHSPQVWHNEGDLSGTRPDPDAVDVCYLASYGPPPQVVDAEVVETRSHEVRPIACPAGCGAMLLVDTRLIPGDQVTCAKCQQISTLPQPDWALDGGLGWRELLAGHAVAIENHDRDTRVLATADQAHTELEVHTTRLDQVHTDARYTVPEVYTDAVVEPPADLRAPALARLDLALAVGRCYVCDKPSEELTCPQCQAIIDGPRR